MESYIAVMLCSYYTDDVDHDERGGGGGNNIDDTVDLILYLLSILATWHITVMSISSYFRRLAFESGQKLSNVTFFWKSTHAETPTVP
jgi:hypothetical protein